jgi:hypothetical protein
VTRFRDLGQRLGTSTNVTPVEVPEPPGRGPRNHRTDTRTGLGTTTNGGTSVLLTTQYLDEADRLADHVAVLLGFRPGADAAGWLALTGFFALFGAMLTWLSVAMGRRPAPSSPRPTPR